MHARLFPLALAAAACLAACSPPSATERGDTSAAEAFPALSGRVVDEAGLLRPEDEARLTRALAALEDRTTDQLVIVTVPTLGDRPIADYARELGNHWGVGQEDKDNGVLILVAPSERQVRIEVGYGLESTLTNDRAAEIIDRDMLPHFRADRPAIAIENGTRAVIATLIAGERQPRQGRP